MHICGIGFFWHLLYFDILEQQKCLWSWNIFRKIGHDINELFKHLLNVSNYKTDAMFEL